MKNPFSRPQPVAKIPNPLTLAQRVDRIRPIIEIMVDRAITKRPNICKLATNPQLKQALDLLCILSDEGLDQFLTMLEDGVPDELRHML